MRGKNERRKKKRCMNVEDRVRHGANKSEKSHTVTIISAIVFITLSIITITVLGPHMYPIPRIISSLSVAPRGRVIICCCCRHGDACLQPTRCGFFSSFLFSTLFFWDSGCARFTVATVGCCFRSHYSDPLMTLK